MNDSYINSSNLDILAEAALIHRSLSNQEQGQVRTANFQSWQVASYQDGAKISTLLQSGDVNFPSVKQNKHNTNRQLDHRSVGIACYWSGCIVYGKVGGMGVGGLKHHIAAHLRHTNSNQCRWEGCGQLFSSREDLKTHLYDHVDQMAYPNLHGVLSAKKQKIKR